MLAYLDSLCEALTERNDVEVRRLLDHRLARHLSRRVRDEATALSRSDPERRTRPPVAAMEFRHQMAQLLRDTSPSVPASGLQLELALRLGADAHEASVSLARAAIPLPLRRRRAG